MTQYNVRAAADGRFVGQFEAVDETELKKILAAYRLDPDQCRWEGQT